MIGFMMSFAGIVAGTHGYAWVIDAAWIVLTVGIIMAVFGSVLFMAMSKKASTASWTAPNAVVPTPVAAPAEYSSDPVISRIFANPYVLLDERIRQLHEVQNLLQYPEIQQIFFEPAKLNGLSAQPRVRELLNIVRDRIARNNAEEMFAAVESRRPANMPQTVQTNKT